jgi:hypothetical protein
MDITRLQSILVGRKIISVEEGATAGWMLLHLDAPQGYPGGTREYMTIFVGGRKEENSESMYHATAALKTQPPTGWGRWSPIRDPRDPEMPMSSAAPFELHRQAARPAEQSPDVVQGSVDEL